MHPLYLLLLGAAVLFGLTANKSESPPMKTPADPTPPTPPVDPEPIGKVRSADYARFMKAYAQSPYHNLIAEAEIDNNLPEDLLAKQLWVESRFKIDAVSTAGAQGIAQFMPATAEEFGIDPFVPEQDPRCWEIHGAIDRTNG